MLGKTGKNSDFSGLAKMREKDGMRIIPLSQMRQELNNQPKGEKRARDRCAHLMAK